MGAGGIPGRDLERRAVDLLLRQLLAARDRLFLRQVGETGAMEGLLRHLHLVDADGAVRADRLGQRRGGALEREFCAVGVAERADLDDPAAERRRGVRRALRRGYRTGG